jgi:lantibiotic modifying enzyme
LSVRAGIDAELAGAGLELAARIAAAARPAAGGRSWDAAVIAGEEDGRPVLGHGDVGPALYDGTAGIGLALAVAAGAAGGDAGVLAIAARGAVGNALAQAPELVEQERLGLFDGAAGIALAAVTAGRALGDAGLADRGCALARTVAARLPRAADPPAVDLIGGLAGTILGVIGCCAATGEAAPARELGAAAGRLAARAVPQTWGEAWPPPGGGQPLLGLGHGAAGIALALAEVAALGGDPALGHAARAAVEYERGWFDPERPGWPDLRATAPGDDPESWMSAWCHGALGIGLSRLRLARLGADPLDAIEAAAAIQSARDLVVTAGTALRAGEAADCSACHGLAGAVELMLVAARALGATEHAGAARRAARLLLAERDAAGGEWPCGLAGAGAIPALMTGTAGIALTLLRASGATMAPTPLLPGSAGW